MQRALKPFAAVVYNAYPSATPSGSLSPLTSSTPEGLFVVAAGYTVQFAAAPKSLALSDIYYHSLLDLVPLPIATSTIAS